MKSAIVPAQITTVEDKVAGNLSLSQMLLLVAPVFIGSALYVLLPPSMDIATYKIVVLTVIAVGFGLLAVRIKGRIVLLWLITIARYNLRPRYYVFDKNDMHLRPVADKSELMEAEDQVENLATEDVMPALTLNPHETVMLEQIMANPKARMHFKTNRKGGLSVRITEIKD